MSHVKLAVVALAVLAGRAGAQAPAILKTGAEAVMIDLVGRPAGGGAPDTTSILASRTEVQRFLARAQARRDGQLRACGAADPDTPTMGGAANGWRLELTCTRPQNGAAVTWGLRYTAAGGARATRTATLGTTPAAEAWLAKLNTLTEGPRPIRLKPLPPTE